MENAEQNSPDRPRQSQFAMVLQMSLQVLTSAGALFWKRFVAAKHTAATETFVAFEPENLISRAHGFPGRKGQWPPDLPTLLKYAPDLTITNPNPNMGNGPLYEYVCPMEFRSDRSPAIVFYQLREGERALILHAANADGAVSRPHKD